MSEHGTPGVSVNTAMADLGSKCRAPKRASAGKLRIAALAASVVAVGSLTACSSSDSASTSTSAPASASSSESTSASAPASQEAASEASGVPAEVISAYFKATCVAPSTYEDATETCTDDKGEATSVTELNFDYTPVRAMQVSFAYFAFPPEKFPDCPSQADMDAYQNDESNELPPPPVSDACLTSVLVALTGLGDIAASLE